MRNFNLKSVLVVDIEATCWEPKPLSKSKEFESEIIEVGICELSLDKGISNKRSIIIRPQYSKVSDFCTGLTTLTQKDVDAGTSLRTACETLESEFGSRNKVWASYGDYDRKQFEKECRSKSVDYPFGPRHINVKNLFALMFRLDREVGMPEALDLLGLKLEGTHHRGVDDASNIAKILEIILEKKELKKF
jgi:inhibitor of KinA sporulation pathway (predicted exonuclease)